MADVSVCSVCKEPDDCRACACERSRIKDQPPPIPRALATAVWDLVLEDCAHKPGPTWERVRRDMHERDQVGRERYGTPLTTNNGRDHLVDAYQEALDLAVYLRAQLEEWADSDQRRHVLTIYTLHLVNVHHLRSVIDDKEQAHGR
ncbi:MAG TPA: hypothetical protein VMZ53_03695 [Kofleriaceae bacterium]|nr:hypothetical protein [Kofleriaceae bacterium]